MFKFLNISNKGIATLTIILLVTLVTCAIGTGVLLKEYRKTMEREINGEQETEQPIEESIITDEATIIKPEEDTNKSGSTTDEAVGENKESEEKEATGVIIDSEKPEPEPEPAPEPEPEPKIMDLPVISHPIRMIVAKVDATIYRIIITVENPFPYPINAKTTHGSHSWNMSIPPYEREKFEYEIYPSLGVENVISPARMEYYDFQYGSTIKFDSDPFVFTPPGVMITGDLPYKIDQYMEIDFEITNLINVSNGVFNLKLTCADAFKDEVYEFDVSKNIKDILAISVKFGPIDVPEGDYIAVISFQYNDESLPIDARNMQK